MSERHWYRSLSLVKMITISKCWCPPSDLTHLRTRKSKCEMNFAVFGTMFYIVTRVDCCLLDGDTDVLYNKFNVDYSTQEPQPPDNPSQHPNSNYNCVVDTTDGQWKVARCDQEQHLVVCQSDYFIPTGTATNCLLSVHDALTLLILSKQKQTNAVNRCRKWYLSRDCLGLHSIIVYGRKPLEGWSETRPFYQCTNFLSKVGPHSDR